jgi:putative ABC transport system permease protein
MGWRRWVALRPRAASRRVPEESRLSLRDLSSEATAGILQRPARTALTMLGTVLSVGSFTAVLGLTATARGQVSSDFTKLAATQVTVNDIGDRDVGVNTSLYDFPADADDVVGRLHGVVHAGVHWRVFGEQPNVSALSGAPVGRTARLDAYAASPGYLQAIDPTLKSGTLFSRFHDSRHMRVAVLGSAAASALNISNLTAQPAIFINGVGYTVIGIISKAERAPEDLLGVLIPAQTALASYGKPNVHNAPSMLIETRLGAAQLIARQAPTALRPDNSTLLQAVSPADPHALKDTVAGNLNTLFLALAAITLVIGAVGITNTTMVAVMERIGEIGLRRCLGARPRHVAGQFLAETTVLGTVGGLIGTALGIATVLLVAVSRHWTAILDPLATLPAPLIGTVTGLVAGAYPAIRAARIEPLEALRR